LWNPLENRDLEGVRFVEKVFVQKNGEPHPQRRQSGTATHPEFSIPSPGPADGFRSTNHQLFQHYQVSNDHPPEPTSQGFVNDYQNAMVYGTYAFGDAPCDPRQIMTCYTPEQVPVLSTLAREFAVCDQWFASVPGQTLPNRHFVHAATSNGQVSNSPNPQCDARTIFNVLQEAIDRNGRNDLSWKVYAGMDKGKFFSLTRLVLTQLQSPRFDGHFLPIDKFYSDAAAGTLPSYAFLEPQFYSPGGNDQGPPQDIRPGEQLIANVYNAVVRSPQWKETLLIITYSSHGGCYDHVPPPNHATPPEKDRRAGQDGFLFNRFGLRVPAVLVSPWIDAGLICRPQGPVPFDHTSIIASIRRCFGLRDSLSERDRAAPDLSCSLTLRQPRKDRPKVQPLAYQPEHPEGHTHGLHHLIAEIFEKSTGWQRAEKKSMSDFIHEAYEAMFVRRK
jgi:phospholipase C